MKLKPEHPNTAANAQETVSSGMFHVSKAGKKLPIQIGMYWYEDFDQTKYMPFRTLMKMIPRGNPGFVEYSSAKRTLLRLMKHPGFGTTEQFVQSLPTGQGAMREHTTYLLTKQQCDQPDAFLD